jgi:hypothetical protein
VLTIVTEVGNGGRGSCEEIEKFITKFSYDGRVIEQSKSLMGTSIISQVIAFIFYQIIEIHSVLSVTVIV